MRIALGVILLLAHLPSLAAQRDGPELQASVDADHVSVGEELTYTLRAISHSPMLTRVRVAPLNGLELVGRSESTELAAGDATTRTTIIEIRVRAVRPGRWQIGPAVAVQGRDSVEAPSIVIDVAANRAATASTINPRLRRMLDATTPPSNGQPEIDLLVSSDTARVGEQVDVVTLAWFPRDLRLQLRRPPTIQPPVIDGVWSYPQSTPGGIAATRNVHGRWYDLFVSHQIVFPLVAGRVYVPRATLKYSTPVALQFFSQEERYALSSDPDSLVVTALPASSGPATFTGAVGSGLRLERRITPATAHAGEGVAVELSVRGEGNLALWPSVDVSWPATGRAYLERVEEHVESTDGLLGGTKTFRYLLVPDSAGVLPIPAVRYEYFDLAAGRYLEIGAPATTIAVLPGGESAANAALPPGLLPNGGPALAWVAAHSIPDWVWLLLLVLPPLIASVGRLRLPRRRHAVATSISPGNLRGAEHELESLLEVLVPESERRTGGALAVAIRAAGADADLASRVLAVRDRLLARRYGPDAGTGEDAELSAEVEGLVRKLGGTLKPWRVRGLSLLLVALASGTARLPAQAPAPERLYETGSLRAAADAFSRRAEAEPAVAAHRYNLGATYYRMGLKGKAAAAWLGAKRLAPRSPALRRALALSPLADPASARWTWSPPVTPEELLLGGGMLWVFGWIIWLLRPRARERVTILLVLGGCGLAGGLGLRAWYRRPLAIVTQPSTLRLSPHGLAPAVAPLEEISAVTVLRRVPGWLLVRAPGSREGWVSNDAIVRIGG